MFKTENASTCFDFREGIHVKERDFCQMFARYKVQYVTPHYYLIVAETWLCSFLLSKKLIFEIFRLFHHFFSSLVTFFLSNFYFIFSYLDVNSVSLFKKQESLLTSLKN